ncbi:MAG: RagB/SusD family nutrient uptake outer membrane protein, partial [Prevotella sp.]|nr:RagB/SusD family nutrient uptake outer membrane protein [Prevotella sp.]
AARRAKGRRRPLPRPKLPVYGGQWNTFNDAKGYGEGSFNAARDYYRPLPQSFLDGITNQSGATLSDTEKAAMQNPGY